MRNKKRVYDAACKRVLSEKSILAWIMKSCMDEYKNCDIREIVDKYIEGEPKISTEPVMPESATGIITGMDTADKSPEEGTVYYDILYRALLPNSNDNAAMIINIESQNDFHQKYSLVERGIYYCCRLISSQFKGGVTHSEYDKLSKVYSVWICVDPPDYRKNTITGYSLTEKTIIGNSREKHEKYDLISIVMVYLGQPGEQNAEVLEILDTVFDFKISAKEKIVKLQDDYGIKLTGNNEKEIGTMSNLAQGLIDYGIEQGREQGVASGMAAALLGSIKNLTKSTGWSVEKAMQMMDIPENERQKFRDMLKNGVSEGGD